MYIRRNKTTEIKRRLKIESICIRYILEQMKKICEFAEIRNKERVKMMYNEREKKRKVL